ncbi:MAG TPA: DUF6644 family protein [Hyphomonadaceae bacterium]|nr:DUF6644 family protein [Hyphomonadaceae bacterium]
MTLESAASWLENLPFPTAIRESAWLYPIFETIHVMALALVVGSIATVDLRLLGVARRNQPAWRIAQQALPWTWIAFAVAVVTGALLFSSQAVKYVDNVPFRIKLVLLALAGINMAAFQFGAGRTINTWGEGQAPTGARIAGALSLVFWIGVVAAGRWIGFASNNPF